MFFQRLKDLREDRDLLQKDVAEMLGISQTVYSRYERGFQTIPVPHLIKLADFYQTSTDYIQGKNAPGGDETISARRVLIRFPAGYACCRSRWPGSRPHR